uniref:non-specific serine/threonine protein kinase n=1 Tax=Romanomermis culicivorax TaxID=13658 RepID=A0A915IH10_ROMCU
MPLERKLEVDSIFDGRWKVVKILGEGAFGAVYEVVDNQNPVKIFALKIETNAEQKGGPPKMLPLEVTVLRALRDAKATHYPGYVCCGKTELFNYVVMGLVGKNLNELRKTMPFRRFTLYSCLHIGSTSLLSLEEIHRAGYLHRDIKPANMCIGREPHDTKSVYILDWGLCRLYLNEKRIIHRPRIKVAFRGTPWYASVSALMEKDQGRCDDIWAWLSIKLFCLIEYTTGKLPWVDMDSTPPRDKATLDNLECHLAWTLQSNLCLDPGHRHSSSPMYWFLWRPQIKKKYDAKLQGLYICPKEDGRKERILLGKF